MTDKPSLLFIFGVGYSAHSLAQRLLAKGWGVTGTVRTPEKAARLADAGIAAEVWPGQGQLTVPGGAHWLITVPPDADGCPAARAVSPEDAASAGSITYLSTTGVYGDLNGGWAFEWSPVHPQAQRAVARVKAEQQWQALSAGRARVVRLPGIYGPGRSAFDRLRSGRARRIIKPGQVFSRVHVDDISAGLEALALMPDARGVFHLCDDRPAPPQDVIAYAAYLIGHEVPPDIAFETADLSPMARSFYADCKRVSNARAKAVLGWRPAYPSYKKGLRAILDAEAPEDRYSD